MIGAQADTALLGRPSPPVSNGSLGVDRVFQDAGTPPATSVADGSGTCPAGGPRPPRAADGGGACDRRRLNAQEATIARMMVEGSDERQVATELHLSVVALRAHVARICAKLDLPASAYLRFVIGHGTTLTFTDTDTDIDACRRCSSTNDRRLGQQEAAVLDLLQQGLNQREVAAELCIGIATVRSHLAHIRAKLDDEVTERS